ncbi:MULTISPECIES: helix-turn-helix domain-containing protein [unclassified Microbacterium]|uniref:helix-turn-helix domain-containing protein n=1 Tax=Microbacterium TaxID=33882 RepID=UPI003B9FDCA8
MTEALNKRLAARVAALRADRGFSQERLAEHAGLHRTYIGQIERGTANATLAAVEKIAAALQADTDRLLCSGGQDG